MTYLLLTDRDGIENLVNMDKVHEIRRNVMLNGVVLEGEFTTLKTRFYNESFEDVTAALGAKTPAPPAPKNVLRVERKVHKPTASQIKSRVPLTWRLVLNDIILVGGVDMFPSSEMDKMPTKMKVLHDSIAMALNIPTYNGKFIDADS